MSVIVNYRSGNISYKVWQYDNDGNRISTFRELKTVQVFNPTSEEPNIAVIDSLSEHNMGYFNAPIKYSYVLGVLPSRENVTPAVLSDAEFLTQLQVDASEVTDNLYAGVFDLEVSDNVNQGTSITYKYCVVATNNVSNVVVDALPVSEFTLLSLDTSFGKGGDDPFSQLPANRKFVSA